MRKSILISLFFFTIVSCNIVKRRYNSGYYISTNALQKNERAEYANSKVQFSGDSLYVDYTNRETENISVLASQSVKPNTTCGNYNNLSEQAIPVQKVLPLIISSKDSIVNNSNAKLRYLQKAKALYRTSNYLFVISLLFLLGLILFLILDPLVTVTIIFAILFSGAGLFWAFYTIIAALATYNYRMAMKMSADKEELSGKLKSLYIFHSIILGLEILSLLVASILLGLAWSG